MAAHINLLGRVCGNGVCAWEVGQVYTVSFVVETADFCIYGYTAVVAHMLVLVSKGIEN